MAIKDTIASTVTATKSSGPVAGVLDKFIPQISRNTQSIGKDTFSWEIVLKGPILRWEELQQILNRFKNEISEETSITAFISNTGSVIQWDTSYYGGGVNQTISNIIYPYTKPEYTWHVKEYRMNQCDAGLHCEVTITWGINQISSGGDGEEEEPLNIYWTISMVPTQIDVLEYCADPDNVDEINGDVNGKATSWRIKQWASVDNNNNSIKSQYQFAAGVGSVGLASLNASEIAIAKLYNAGVNPQFHYPVIQVNKEYMGKRGLKTVDISKIDIKTKNIPDCPFEIKGFEWLQTGYTASYNTVRDITTITTEWTGAQSWLDEFYSDDKDKRWTLHNM